MPPFRLLPLAALLVTGASQPSAAGLVLIGAIVASLRRNHPIGGWLFFFFWGVAAGCIITITSINWATLAPRLWRDQVKFLAYVFTIAPGFAVMLAIAGVGLMLLWTYDRKWIVVLRYLLILLAVFSAISVLLDSYYFPSRVQAAVNSLGFPVGYAIYFSVSTRVRSVFIDRMWKHRAVSV
jgi:hypothetical protein